MFPSPQQTAQKALKMLQALQGLGVGAGGCSGLQRNRALGAQSGLRASGREGGVSLCALSSKHAAARGPWGRGALP